MEINKYVKIKEDAPDNLMGAYGKIAKDKNFPLLVYALPTTNSLSVYTKNIPDNNSAQNPFVIDKKYVLEMTDAEVKKYYNNIDKINLKKKEEQLKKIRTKHITIDKRKIENTTEKQFLNTVYNYLILYDKIVLVDCKNKITPQTKRHNTGHAASCCSLTRTDRDIVVYIPKSWLNYYGYNLTNLKCYLSFLAKCEIGFKGEVLGTKTLEEMFNIRTTTMNLANTSNNTYLSHDEDCYEVWIPASNQVWITYLYFILVRFMYSSMYSNIPFIAMKLKKNMPKATHWECLLIAHCFQNYEPYYSLTANTPNGLAIPSKYNSPKNILLNLSGKTGMNGAFKKYNENTSNLRNAIQKEDYKMIQETINKYKETN